jgi:hypothetical protein
MRYLHPTRPRLLAHLPRLRRTRPDPYWRQRPLRALHRPPTAAPDPRRRHRLHPPELQALRDALAATNRTATVETWLNRSAALSILQALAGQPLTHDTLDALPPGNPVEHLRSVLVAIGTLPARDEQLARLQWWITDTIATRANPDEQHLLRRYAIWHVLRRLSGRLRGVDTTHHQFIAAKRNIHAAVTLLDRLADHGRTLATARQADLDQRLAYDSASREAGNFIRWAHRDRLTTLELPATRWAGPTALIDTEARWERARLLLHDDTLDTEARVAGLLVLLYAQQPATISRLTVDHLQISPDSTRLRLGREPVVLPEPLAGLVRDLASTRNGHAVIGALGTSPWPFPGGQPGRPISAMQLAERLRNLGLSPARSRSTALFELVTEHPAAILARTLGIHISVAAAWQRASAGE